MTKRFSILLALVAFAAILVPSAAFANFAIHGNYVNDTDACAGCHRAHTSVSSITWADAGGNNHSALLVSSATTMREFCYACHDSQGQSADTNVSDGLYYGTDYGANMGVLNGGGFESFVDTPTTSQHQSLGAAWGAYGGGYFGQGANGATGNYTNTGNPKTSNLAGESNKIAMDCATCHDPHGSANYRILKSLVNGNYVGGYVASATAPSDPTPDGYVSSVETGWPDKGFRLHKPGGYPLYQPNYTTPMYAKGYDMATGVENADKGMSGWCAGCHSTYVGNSTKTFTNSLGIVYQSLASTYNAGDGAGYTLRHRHPINVQLASYNSTATPLNVAGLALPVSNDSSETGKPTTEASDWVECLTCHRAHGTIAKMTGFSVDTSGSGLPPFVSGTPSALLRMDNRGVCENCHNK